MTATADGWKYGWDMQNRLIKAEKGETKLEFAYDFMSRRIGRKVYESGKLTSDEKFLFDGFNMTLKHDGKSVQHFAWNGQDLLSMTDGDKSYSYIKDGNKNVIELLSKDGKISAKYAYSPFGETTSAMANDDSNPYRFSSEQWDETLGLAYYNYRYYSPAMGRWLSRDPIAENGGRNIYAFAVNNAVDNWDKLGLLLVVDLLKNQMQERKSKGSIFFNATGYGHLYSTMIYLAEDSRLTYKTIEGNSTATARYVSWKLHIFGPVIELPNMPDASTIMHELSHFYVDYYLNGFLDDRRDEGLAYAVEYLHQIAYNMIYIFEDPFITNYSIGTSASDVKRIWDNLLTLATLPSSGSYGGGIEFTLDKTDINNVSKYYHFNFNCKALAKKYSEAIKSKYGFEPCLDCKKIQNTILE